MHWDDEAILLKQSAFGEASFVVTVLSKTYGKHKGVIKLTGPKKNQLIAGSLLQAHWSARLQEHLGAFRFEIIKSVDVNLLYSRLKWSALLSALSLIDAYIIEKDPHEKLFAMVLELKKNLQGERWLHHYAMFELMFLKELGFALDLNRCAVTNRSDNLFFVSPKTGRAVCYDEGKAYEDKLLPRPKFLDDENNITLDDILTGLKLTHYFFSNHVLTHTGKRLPEAHTRFLQALASHTQTACDIVLVA